jgi:hypothetical protein
MMYQANAPLFGKDDKLAQLLMQQPNYGDMKSSPLQGLAAALGQMGSAYIGKKRKESERADTVATLKGALDLGNGSPAGLDSNGIDWETARAPDRNAMAGLLLGNEQTAPIAERLILGDMDRQQGLQDKIAEMEALLPYEIKKIQAMASARGAGGAGQSPAAIQITNDLMQQYQTMTTDPDPKKRQAAQQRYVMLQQVAKTYGTDRGVLPEIPAYNGSTNPTELADAFEGMGVDTGMAPAPNAPLPLPPVQGPQQPAQIPPVDSPLMSQKAQPMPPAQASPPMAIPEFGKAQGVNAAAKKRAETQAQKDVELDMDPKIRGKEKTAELDAVRADKNIEANILDAQTLPIIADLKKINEKTFDMPFIDVAQGPAKVMGVGKEGTTATDLMRQARLDMAAPLAKQLGVNPTDKDFQATLDRIFDISATKESRDAQINALEKRIKMKAAARNGATAPANNYKEKYGLQ